MKPVIAIMVFLLGAAGIALWVDHRQKTKLAAIDSYEECVKAGYPVELTIPGRCTTPDDRVFVQERSPSP